MQLSPKQQTTIQAIVKKKPFFTLLEGAIRSGKSYIALLTYLLYTQSVGKDKVNIIAGRNLRVMNIEIVQQLMLAAKALGSSVKYKSVDGILTINNVKYVVVAGHDENSYKRIQSMTAGSALIDEIQLIPESFVKQVIARLSFEGSIIIATCNPEGRNHWLKKDYIDTGKIDYIERFLPDDNPTLSDKVKRRNERLFSGVFYDRNIKGEWVQAEGVIFQQYEVTALRTDKPLAIDIGIDYGIKSITAYEMVAYYKDGKSQVIKTYRYNGEDRIKTDQELTDDFVSFANDKKIRTVFIDPSASSMIAELRSRRLKMGIREADNSVLPGIKTLINELARGGLTIANTASNAPLLKELTTYSWDNNKDDKPIKVDDHHCDALRYCYYTRNKNRRRVLIKVPRGL